MDPLEFLMVRFNYGGEFLTVEGHLHYFGGRTGISYIELDKLLLPEVEGHLGDHTKVDGPLQLHWLPLENQMNDGLRLIFDDETCKVMADQVTDSGVAEIFVEEIGGRKKIDHDYEVEMSELEIGEEADDEADNEVHDELEEIDVDVPLSMPIVTTPEKQSIMEMELLAVREFYKSPSKSHKKVVAHAVVFEGNMKEDVSDSVDSDYQSRDINSSGCDEEAEMLRKFGKQINQGIRSKKLGESRNQLLIHATATIPELQNLQDDDSPYLNSSDDYSYGENSEGETTSWQSTENRFDSDAPIPTFSLGMAFRCSRQFKKALVKYGFVTHKHLLFPKDEKNKVKAVCSWKG